MLAGRPHGIFPEPSSALASQGSLSPSLRRPLIFMGPRLAYHGVARRPTGVKDFPPSGVLAVGRTPDVRDARHAPQLAGSSLRPARRASVDRNPGNLRAVDLSASTAARFSRRRR